MVLLSIATFATAPRTVNLRPACQRLAKKPLEYWTSNHHVPRTWETNGLDHQYHESQRT